MEQRLGSSNLAAVQAVYCLSSMRDKSSAHCEEAVQHLAREGTLRALVPHEWASVFEPIGFPAENAMPIDVGHLGFEHSAFVVR
eukprot:647948-Prymnesium_polylepis.1